MFRTKINPAKLTKKTGKLLANLIAENPNEMIFEAGEYEVASKKVKLTKAITGYHRKKKKSETRFAVSDAKPLVAGLNNIHASKVTVKIVNGSAVSKPKSTNKERVVKRPKNNMEIVREAAFLSALSMFGYGNKEAVPDNDFRVGALVMRRLNGKDLYEHLDEGVKFSADQMIELTIMMAEAIEKIHASGIIHRDIKAENFMVEVDKDNNPIGVIPLDYDLAKYKDEEGVVERNIGTSQPVDYRAPEIKREEGAYSDEKSDAYAFAVVLKRKLWRDVNARNTFADLCRVHKQEINDVILGGLNNDNDIRASVGEIADVFKKIRQERTNQSQPVMSM